MSRFEIGDKVKVEVTGTIKKFDAHDMCVAIVDAGFYTHYIYEHSDHVKIEKAEPPRVTGEIYQDADGDLFLWKPRYPDDEKPWVVLFTGGFNAGERVDENFTETPLRLVKYEM